MEKTKNAHSQHIPWWIHIGIAAIMYFGLTYYTPTLHTEIPWISSLLLATPNLAPIGAIVFLLLGAKALYADPNQKGTFPDSKNGNG